MAYQVTALALITAVLVGCETKPEPDPAPSSNLEELAVVGTKIDTSEQKAAAAVTVAIEQANKPEVVKAEGKVALAYLVPPSADDLAFARERASKADQKAYDAQIESAKKLQESIETMWKQLEDEAKKSKQEIDKLKRRNDELVVEVERTKKEASDNAWTLTGAGLAVIGALATAFAGPRIGIPLLLSGAFCGSIPFIMGSEYFAWIAGTTLAIAAALISWRLYDYIKDKNNESA